MPLAAPPGPLWSADAKEPHPSRTADGAVKARHEPEVRDGFPYPYRGKPLESSPLGKQDVKDLVGQERLVLFIDNYIEKELTMLMAKIDGIEIDVNHLGGVELRLNEGGVAMPARPLSEGTLRMLGLLALSAVIPPPGLVGFEEPETGVHPRRIPEIAKMLEARANLQGGQHSQYIVTTHDPFLPDLVSTRSLCVVQRTKRTNHQTCIVPFSTWRESRRRRNVHEAPRRPGTGRASGHASCGRLRCVSELFAH